MPSKNPPATLVGLEGFGSNESRRRIQDVGWRDDRIEMLEDTLRELSLVCTCGNPVRRDGNPGHTKGCVSEIALAALEVSHEPA